ncbi:uncharacterized protein JCM15063_004119 [Sporobolomyces koalae]|uniref:uncharacterized protein n=1 Tax=Sporobolomyces koalae TaxID=500713 RepID=UPI00316D6C2C
MADEQFQASYVQALYAYTGVDSSSLSFRQGDIIEVLSTLESGWWDGIHCDTRVRGWFPSNYVQHISEEDALWAREQTMGWWDAQAGVRRESAPIGGGTALARDLSQISLNSSSTHSGSVQNVGINGANGNLSRDPSMQDFLSAEDLTSFSNGGDIFGEIAAAAQVESHGSPVTSTNGHLARHQGAYSANPLRARVPTDGPEEDYWVPKMTVHGSLFYYNTQTGETSMDIPIDGQGDGVQIDPSEFGREESSGVGGHDRTGDEAGRPTTDANKKAGANPSVGGNNRSETHGQLRPVSLADNASLFSALTARPSGSFSKDDATPRRSRAETGRRSSIDSDDSALDAAFAGAATRERKTSTDPDAAAVIKVTDSKSPRPRKQIPTADLLSPPPPPLLSDLESQITQSLRKLTTAVEAGGVSSTHTSSNEDERNRVAQLGNDVVQSVRLLLHSSGVLDQPLLALEPTSSYAEIFVSTPLFPPLPPSALMQLRPLTRRLVSTLSKLTFSLRAIWGLLETTAQDQELEEDESPADPEETLRRAQIRRQVMNERKAVAAVRIEHDAKLRREMMAGAKDVGEHVALFLAQLDAIMTSLTGAVEKDAALSGSRRAPKASHGALRTNAAALLLPGGGFGGNWRGNGFVSLPSPHSSPNPAGSTGALSYAWPTRAFTRTAVAEISTISSTVSECAEKLKTALATEETASIGIFERSAALLPRVATFLARVEDLDLAGAVDFQLPRSSDSPLVAGAATLVKDDPTASGDDPTASLAYRQSTIEAKPLLVEFETRKQALYDVPARLLSALQSLTLPNVATSTLPSVSSQPVANAPLSCYSRPTSFDPATSPLDVVDDLNSSLSLLCSTLSSLVGIAEVQSVAPRTFRTGPLTFRGSMLDPAPAGKTSNERTEEMGKEPRSRQSHASSAISSLHSRDSVDSDFFFSGAVSDSRRTGSTGSLPHQLSPAATSASSLPPLTSSNGTIRSQSALGRHPGTDKIDNTPGGVGLPPGWDRRRGSVATTTSSGGMGEGTRVGGLAPLSEIAQTSSLTPTRSSSKNIHKLLGEDAPAEAAFEPPKPWYLERDYGDDELSFTMENTIKGGTLQGLVIAATSHEGRVDSSYLSAFLMTYRTFCTGHQLLDKLVERYLTPEPEGLEEQEFIEWEAQKLRPIRARVANLLKAWVREHMEHEEMDRDLLLRIREFATKTMLEKGQSLQICKSVDERMQGVAPRAVGNLAPGSLPAPIVPRNLKKIKFLDLEPLELARQLTIMDGRLFQRITPQECLGKAWPKEFGSEAVNISAMIDMSNAITRWVTETILAQDDQKKRASIIKHFIATAERCLALNNFSTLIHIIAGLNSTPVHRLRRTWESVSQKSIVSLGVLNNIMRPDKNYKEYRDVLRKAAPPCVPFLGVYLTDWTFIGDGNPDMLREKPHQINFHKRQKASELILMIKLHQATTYNLSAVPALATFLQEQLFPRNVDPANDDQRLYDISLQREPRERDDERIARLLGESGFL